MKTQQVQSFRVVTTFHEGEEFYEAYAIAEPQGKIYPVCSSRSKQQAVSYALTEAAVDYARNGRPQ